MRTLEGGTGALTVTQSEVVALRGAFDEVTLELLLLLDVVYARRGAGFDGVQSGALSFARCCATTGFDGVRRRDVHVTQGKGGFILKRFFFSSKKNRDT